MKKLECIMLIDDNADDNFFHQRSVIRAAVCDDLVTIQSADEALDYLSDRRRPTPDLILLDINMPGMNGWEFIADFERMLMQFSAEKKPKVVVLTTSENPDDRLRANNTSIVKAFRTKPLTPEMMRGLVDEFF